MSGDGGGEALTIERIVSVDPPREPRLDPRERRIAYTAEVAGTRQLFVRSLRGTGPAVQVTAGEKAASDPRWSPDGRRLAFVRDGIWVVDADGSREVRIATHPAGDSSPEWSPDGRTISFVSRRRGWSQLWLVDAPVPRRGRPRKEQEQPLPRPLTPSGLDVCEHAWAPDGRAIAIGSWAEGETRSTVSVVDLDGTVTPIAAEAGAWEGAVGWHPDGSLVFVSDASGWFQVVRSSRDGRERTPLTTGERDRGIPDGNGSFGFAPLVSPDGSHVTHPEIHDACCDLMVVATAAGPAKRGRGRPPKVPKPTQTAAGSRKVNPWDGVWRAIGWLADGTTLLAIGESDTRPQDLWLLPVPGLASPGDRPRQLTDSLPAVLRPAFAAGRTVPAERVRITARDGLRLEATLLRPPTATGRRGATKVPTIVFPHGGPTAQAFRSWRPFNQLLARDGFAVLEIDFRGSTGYGRAFRDANNGEWGHADAHDVIDAGRWAAAQPWSNGRLAVYGGSYGGYLVLSALVEEPSIWAAGVDLYGDSDIAESYRRGDRVGRLDLRMMMGDPDDPGVAAAYRRGSPVHRAERIEAPLLILHGRKDRRVVPLMSERMIEALEIEGKHHEVLWFDDEGHGWERPANRRAAFTKIREFLRAHVLEVAGGTEEARGKR